jgi:ribosomal protein S4
LKNKFIKAKAKSENIGINLLKTSVMRLDNVIFCSKLFHTLSFARQ